MPGKRDKRSVGFRVVGISASPRKRGNTDSLLDKALAGARSKGALTKKIFLNGLDFAPCQACGGCDRTGVCVIRDDMATVYNSIESADAVIVASPVFFGTVTAQLKAMIDRFQSRWTAKYVLKNSPGLKKRNGYFLSSAGSAKKKYFDEARKVVRNFFATVDIRYSGELFCGRVEKKGAVKKDRKAMARAFAIGKASVG